MPCAEIYPLNLMQLVLPKGKVRAIPAVVFSFLIQAIPIVKKIERMEITVNHQSCILPESASVGQLLSDILAVSASGIAVAVNQCVVPKSDWPVHQLQQGDKVMLIKATQGG